MEKKNNRLPHKVGTTKTEWNLTAMHWLEERVRSVFMNSFVYRKETTSCE